MDSQYAKLEAVIEPYRGPRTELLSLFALADDAPEQINSYFELGEVFVARKAQEIIGHVQLIATGIEWEIKSVAVMEQHRNQGFGPALIGTALDRAFSTGASRVVIATATADIDNIRFYQRLGFRMERVERDVFTAARGYASHEIDGIPLRDQIWFSMNADERRMMAGTSP